MLSASSCAFTVLTFNVHKGFATFPRRSVLPELREAVRGVAADLVFLQEVLGAHGGSPDTELGVPQYEFLADTVWTEFAYGRNAVYPEGDHGNALLSKFPIASHENRDASIPGQEQRGLLHCRLTMPGAGAMHAICVHLGLREVHRRQQVELLCNMIEHEVPASAPLVVAGDFNDWRGRAHERLGRAGLCEAFATMHGRCARTFPARAPMLRLDRIYVRGLELREARVLKARPWSQLSDHVALAVTVALPEASA